jgi:hypothetical protein
MSAEAIIRALLVADASLGSSVPAAQIYPVEIPEGEPTPAIVISHVSGRELPRIDAQSSFALVQTRVETKIIAKDYPAIKLILPKVRAAANYKRGLIAGFTVISVVRDVTGPDIFDSALGLHSQTLDFMVTWEEPNP